MTTDSAEKTAPSQFSGRHSLGGHAMTSTAKDRGSYGYVKWQREEPPELKSQIFI